MPRADQALATAFSRSRQLDRDRRGHHKQSLCHSKQSLTRSQYGRASRSPIYFHHKQSIKITECNDAPLSHAHMQRVCPIIANEQLDLPDTPDGIQQLKHPRSYSITQAQARG
jgi:hypothetical protein